MRGMRNFLEIGSDCRPLTESGWCEWENAAKRLPELVEKGELRSLINQLPKVNISVLDSGALKRAYVIFTFIAHGYIRGNDSEPCLDVLPEKIASPWIEIGKSLGVPPVATYAATVLFNFKYKEQLQNPEDFEIEFSFTGTEDEKWFYAVSAAIDVHSEAILNCAERLRSGQHDYSEIGLKIADEIDQLTATLNKMYERCQPAVFHGKVRKYLGGWFNDPKLPNGLKYELDSNGNFIFLKLAGGSAAQNPTIQLLDILLGVKHGADSDDLVLSGYNSGCPRMNYLGAMRTYMPTEHCQFLDELESKQAEFLSKFKKTLGYKRCVEALVNFRSEHIKMVTRYIICQSNSGEARGTGGSNTIPFLKKCRFETESCLNDEKTSE